MNNNPARSMPHNAVLRWTQASSNAVGVQGKRNSECSFAGQCGVEYLEQQQQPYQQRQQQWSDHFFDQGDRGDCRRSGASRCLRYPPLPNGLQCYGNPIQGWTRPRHSNRRIYACRWPGESTSSNTVCYTSLDTSQSSSVTFLPGYTYYVQGDFGTGGGSPIKRKRCDFLCRRQCKHCQWCYGKAFGSHSKQRSADAFLCDGEYRHHPGRVELRVLWPVIRAERRSDAE